MSSIAKRLATLILTLVAATSLLFVLVHASGDPTAGFLAPGSSDQVREATRQRLGLDQPLARQYLMFLGNGLTMDFGDSWRNRQPAFTVVAQRLPATLALATASMLIATIGGITLGVGSAVIRSPILRRIVRFVALLGLAIPAFWLGTIAIVVFAVRLGWFPSSGDAGWRSLILPAFTLAAYPGALIARLVQSSLLEISTQPYLVQARAKGLGPAAVWLRHALPNALLPTVAIVGLQASFLVGGAVVVESVFAWPGVGRLAMQATSERDLPVIQAFVTFTIILVALINMATDVIAIWIDPVSRRTATLVPTNG